MTTNKELRSFFDVEEGTKKTEYSGYIIHYTDSPYFPASAVVEDGDKNMTLIDISSQDWEDFEEFLDLVVEEYE